MIMKTTASIPLIQKKVSNILRTLSENKDPKQDLIHRQCPDWENEKWMTPRVYFVQDMPRPITMREAQQVLNSRDSQYSVMLTMPNQDLISWPYHVLEKQRSFVVLGITDDLPRASLRIEQLKSQLKDTPTEFIPLGDTVWSTVEEVRLPGAPWSLRYSDLKYMRLQQMVAEAVYDETLPPIAIFWRPPEKELNMIQSVSNNDEAKEGIKALRQWWEVVYHYISEHTGDEEV